jgi:carboxyl-terminal processing protease
MLKKYYLPIIIIQSILIIACLFGLTLSLLSFSKIQQQETSIPYSEQQLLSAIDKNYLRGTPTKSKIQEYKNKGLVASLNDPYSEYITKEEQVKFDANLNQKYFGVGIKIDKVADSVVVVDVLNGPAKEKGVQKGDILIKINEDLVTQNTNLSEVISKIRGEEKTTVKLQFIRSGQAVDVELERREIRGELVTLDIDGDLAIIRISSFGENLDSKLSEKAKLILNNQGIKRIALDVRSDTGGLLNEAIDVISYFLPDNSVVVKERFKEGSANRVQEIRSKAKTNSLVKYPVAIMTDRFSASASEILAAALRDNRDIKIYGEKTFGKGVVQKIFPLESGDYVKLTISEWLTPKDKAIDKVGIEPDVKADPEKNILEKVKSELK